MDSLRVGLVVWIIRVNEEADDGRLGHQLVKQEVELAALNPQDFGLSERAGREARLIVTDESHHACREDFLFGAPKYPD